MTYHDDVYVEAYRRIGISDVRSEIELRSKARASLAANALENDPPEVKEATLSLARRMLSEFITKEVFDYTLYIHLCVLQDKVFSVAPKEFWSENGSCSVFPAPLCSHSATVAVEDNRQFTVLVDEELLGASFLLGSVAASMYRTGMFWEIIDAGNPVSFNDGVRIAKHRTDLIRYVCDRVISYILSDSSLLTTPINIPVLSPLENSARPPVPTEFLIECITLGFDQFVIAHELAHVFCGHFHGDNLTYVDPRQTKLNYEQNSELDADIAAQQVIIKLCNRDGFQQSLASDLSLVGAALYLLWDYIVDTSVYRAINGLIDLNSYISHEQAVSEINSNRNLFYSFDADFGSHPTTFRRLEDLFNLSIQLGIPQEGKLLFMAMWAIVVEVRGEIEQRLKDPRFREMARNRRVSRVITGDQRHLNDRPDLAP